MRLSTVLASIFLATLPALAEPGYSVAPRLHAAGEQGWDLLTADSSRVYVTHGDRVEVFTIDSGKLVGSIAGLAGAHGVAIVPPLGKGFVTSGKDSSLVVFDLKTLAVTARLPAGGVKPDAILFDSASNRLFVGLAGSRALSVFDPVSGKKLGAVTLPGNPELMAADGKGMLYVAIEDKSLVMAIDARLLSVKASWPLAPGQEPTGLAIDAAHRRLFAGCGNQMLVVLDADNGRVVTHLPIGEHIDGVVFDPILGRAYASGGDGTLTVIQEDSQEHFRVQETVKTRPGARTVALDVASHRLWLPTASFGSVPAATAQQPKPRAPVLPNTFTVLEVEPVR